MLTRVFPSIGILLTVIFQVIARELVVLSNTSTLVDDANSACADEERDEVPIWISQGGIILIVLGMLAFFWGLAEVCDRYFCASLLVLCEINKIPDNVISDKYLLF